jgi:hypothetical protein
MKLLGVSRLYFCEVSFIRAPGFGEQTAVARVAKAPEPSPVADHQPPCSNTERAAYDH